MDQPNVTVTFSNFTSSPGHPRRHDYYSRGLVPSVILSFFFVVGVPGNFAVIILRPNWQRMSSLTQSLLLNLAISDLLCLLTFPFWIHTYLCGWTFGQVACKLLEVLVYCATCGSLLTVTGLSVQRYLMVVHQLDCHEEQKRRLLVLLWLVAFILSIPTLVVQEVKTHRQWTECKPEYSSDAQWVTVLMTESVLGFGSFFTVVFSYLRLKRKVNQAAFFNNRYTIKLITSIIVSLFVLWIPYYTLNVVGVVGICLKNESLLNFYSSKRRIAVAIVFITPCLNPLLYAFTSLKRCNVCQKNEPLQQNQRIPSNPGIRTLIVS